MESRWIKWLLTWESRENETSAPEVGESIRSKPAGVPESQKA